MADVTEKIAWTCIGIGALMQIFASVWLGTGLATVFTNLPSVNNLFDVAVWVVTATIDFLQALIGFLTQSWAETFWLPIRFLIAVIFDLSIILLFKPGGF